MLPLRRLSSRKWPLHVQHTSRAHSASILQQPVLEPSITTILAIESSCDDTAVALLDLLDVDERQHDDTYSYLWGARRAFLRFNKRITANNAGFGGIHPLVAHEAHQAHLSTLIREAIGSHSEGEGITLSNHGKPDRTQYYERDTNILVCGKEKPVKPDLIAVTRGPGMRSNLTTGLDTAKGLSVAWQIPLIGVHHMQAHALTPRLVNALSTHPKTYQPSPDFPFLTLLVSGGHTTLLHTSSLISHQVLAETADIAIGVALDKIGRIVIPRHLLKGETSVSFGPLLERFAFPPEMKKNENTEEYHYDYTPPSTPKEEDALARRASAYGWKLPTPLFFTDQGQKRNSMMFSFTGLATHAERIARYGWDELASQFKKTERSQPMSEHEARLLARSVMRAAFEHLASRIYLALSTQPNSLEPVKTVVVSGGVASNKYLRHILRSYLSVRGFPDVEICIPPIEYCTDNAAMIAWAGYEMYQAGLVYSDLSIRALRKWSLENILHPEREEGGKATSEANLLAVDEEKTKNGHATVETEIPMPKLTEYVSIAVPQQSDMPHSGNEDQEIRKRMEIYL